MTAITRVGLAAEIDALASDAGPLTIGLAGAGQMGTDIVVELSLMAGVKLGAISEVRMDAARDAALLAGWAKDDIAVAAKALNPRIRVVGAEPAGADDAARSLRAGALVPALNPASVADGLLASLGELTFAEIRRHVDDIVTVPDAQIIAAMRAIDRGQAKDIMRCWPCHIATMTGVRPAICASMSAGARVKRLVARTSVR